MIRQPRAGHAYAGWVSALVGMTLPALFVGTDSALAQRRPIADDTLGEERSIVTPLDPDLPVDRIDGGAERGDNLFHSFQEFHVDEGRGVYFDDRGFANIISRVTGGVASDILGVIGVIGDANLFLINPSGIIFGPGASLDVSGSFVASTADSFVFENGFAFSATNPQAPPLLTVSVPIGLQYGAQIPGAISVNQAGLFVDSGQSLILAGGAIKISSSGLFVRNPQGGRIELGAVSGAGTVGLEQNGSILSLGFLEDVTRSDVQIINESVIDATAENGGSIAVNAQNLNILDGSRILAGVGAELGTANSQSGDIVLNVTDTITVEQSSLIANNIFSDAIGNAGNLHITAGSLFVTDGAQLQTVTLGRGNAGNVIIKVRDRAVFNGTNDNGQFPSAAISGVDTNAVGNGGSIEIDTSSLEVRDGAQLITGNRERAEGNGGDIRITTGSLLLDNGARLQTSVFGQGDAGDVIINARDRVSLNNSVAVSSVGASSFDGVVEGNGGDIRITTGSLLLDNGARLQTSVFGQGDAGDVIINARDRVSLNNSVALSSVGGVNFDGVAEGNGGDIRITTGFLSLTDDAQLQATTFEQGDAGNVIVSARDRVLFDNSTAFSDVERNAVGHGGNIEISANSLELVNSGQLVTSTNGEGNAGDVIINARDTVSIEGVDNDGRSSALLTTAFAEAQGQGGDAIISANSVHITDGAVVNAQTLNSFRGGDVTINADTFEVRGGGQVITTTSNSGRAGNITLNVTDRITLSGFDPDYDDRRNQFSNRVSNQGETSGLLANTAEGSSGRGGTIHIRTGELNISDRARISVNNQGSGVAGDIDITAQSVEIDRGRLTAETNTVEGGNIAIATDSLSLTNSAQISVNSVTEDEGGAGDIEVQARNIELEASEITAGTRSGQGGNIALSDVELLLLRNGSLISTTAGTEQAGGDGGNITIDADFIVAFPNENSDIRADAFTGSGGRVDITTEGLFGIEARDQPTEFSDITASSEQGVQGTININTPDVDPSRGLTELPAEVVDASDQIAQACPTDGDIAGEVGEFVVTGRGGLPADPAELLAGETILSELAEIQGETRGEIDRSSEIASNDQTETVEAQGWVVGTDGKVMLVAEHPAVEPQGSPIAPVSCPSS